MVDQDIQVKIIVATHKQYQMPSDSMYYPLHVGAADKFDSAGNPVDLGYPKDNTGKNISLLNPSFCELTGLYWAWKNLDADYIGLAHYRRHFSLHKKASFDEVLTYDQLRPFLNQVRIIVPNKRKYYIESLYSHYAHTHYPEHLEKTRNILEQLHPEYLDCYDKVMKRTYGYMFNMFIMDRALLEQYCSWLFTILFTLKEHYDKSGEMDHLSDYQGRFYGRISEMIFNVWLEKMVEDGKIQKDQIKEIPVVTMEKINWFKKGWAFMAAKFLHKKYDDSFRSKGN